jgi:hypothetical protein
MHEHLRPSVRAVIELLVARRYAELEALTKGVRLSQQQIAKAIADYGRELVVPPENAYGLLDATEVRLAQPPRWSVTMPLWTREEGRSDLSLELTLVAERKAFGIELDDIHVL